MNKENSVIGCGYIPRDVEAICLKTNREAELGEVEYKIIAEPYEREWSGGMLLPFGMPKAEKRMTVNVLDANTGLTYAVEYEPANLVRITSEPKTDKPREKVEFIDRVQQIAEELAGIFSAGGGFRTSAVLCFLRFQTTVTVKRTRVRHSLEDAAIAFAKASPPRVQKIAKFSSW